MTPTQTASLAAIRATIFDALAYANALETQPRDVLGAFTGGRRDIAVADLALDSLARMELMIALEMTHGVAITPDELPAFATLGALAESIARRAGQPEHGAAMPRPAVPDARGAPYPPIVALYRRALRGCRSVNQVNKLHIDLENRVTPAELDVLQAAAARGDLDSGPPDGPLAGLSGQWLDQMTALCHPNAAPSAPTFQRVRLAPAIQLFRGPGNPAQRTLLVCFSTRARRMMMPHAAFLSAIDAAQFDVMIVADARRQSFESGVPALGGSLAVVIRWIAAQDVLGHYRCVRTLGCSGGGFAAIVAAPMIGAELGVSIGGRFPHARHLTRLRWTLRAWRGARARQVPVLTAFGADKTRDRKFARAMRRATGARLMPVTVADGEVGHLVLESLRQRGELRDFLARTICAPVDAQSPVAAVD